MGSLTHSLIINLQKINYLSKNHYFKKNNKIIVFYNNR